MPEYDVTITLEISGATSEEEAVEEAKRQLEKSRYCWRLDSVEVVENIR